MAHAGRKAEEDCMAKGGKVEHEGKGHSHHQHHGDHDGHVAHLHMHEKGGKVKKKAKGGVIPMSGTSPMAKVRERGHEVKKVTKKHGGKVEGREAHHSIGKKARGGRMTPSSPLSGADVKPMGYMAEHRAEAPLTSKIPQKIEGRGKDKSGAYGSGSR